MASGAKNINQVYERVKLRQFDAYLQILDNLSDICKVHEPVSRLNAAFGGKLFAVKRFTLSSALNTIPQCIVSLPTGELVTNPSAKQSTSINGYDFAPVRDLASFNDTAVENETADSTQYKACILWYRECLNDTDQDESVRYYYKPILKGVTLSSNFTRVAYRQESIDLSIQHFIVLLNSVLISNALYNLQSDNSTAGPMLIRPKSSDTAPLTDATAEEVYTAGGLDKWLHSHLAAVSNLPLFDTTIEYLLHTIDTYKEYPIPYDDLAADMGAAANVMDSTMAFIKKLLKYIQTSFNGLAGAYKSDPELTKDNAGDNGNTDPKLAFCTAVEGYKHNNYSGVTLYRLMAAIAERFTLYMVCTANTVSFEAIRYRTKTWAKGFDPCEVSTCIMSGKEFSREIVSSVVRVANSPSMAERNELESSGYVIDGSDNGVWGPIYVDDGVLDDTALGSVILFDAPDWYNCGYSEADLRRWVMGNRNESVPADGSVPPPAATTPPKPENEKVKKALEGLTKSLHFEAKAKGRSLQVDMPFNISVALGMPVCIKDSRKGICSSGIIQSFRHNLSQEEESAQTTITLINIDTFKAASSDGGMLKYNPKASAEDDKNPFFDKAFTGRPIYR